MPMDINLVGYSKDVFMARGRLMPVEKLTSMFSVKTK